MKVGTYSSVFQRTFETFLWCGVKLHCRITFILTIKEIVKVKLATLVKGDPKAPFSIATTQRCMEGCYSISWIDQLSLDIYLIMMSFKQSGIKYHFFKSLVGLDHGRTLYSLGQWPCIKEILDIYIWIYIYIYRVQILNRVQILDKPVCISSFQL